MKQWNQKAILFKGESVYGSDPTPTGAANAVLFNASNVRFQPMEGTDVSRDLQRLYFGAQESFPTVLHAIMSFTTELAGSGVAGTAPAWGPLMRACRMSEVISAGVSVTYAPVTLNPESGTLYFHLDGVLQKMLGCRGTWEIGTDANNVPKITWTIYGLWSAASDIVNATPTLDAWQEPLVANKANTPTFTINNIAFVMRSYKLTLGNDVQPRFLIGKEEIVVVDRAPALTATVEAVPMATFNPFAVANARSLQPVALVHGTVAGNIVTINCPTAQMKRPSAIDNNQNIVEWPLAWSPLPDTGNDELSIVCT